jgi:hypothetical protein
VLAAQHIVEALRRLRRQGGSAVLMHRGEHALWRAVTVGLTSGGWDVVVIGLPANDCRWDPPQPAGLRRVRHDGQDYACDALLYHDPFVPEAGSRFVAASVDRLARADITTVFIDFPVGLTNPGLQATLERVYTAAYSVAVSELAGYAETLAAHLEGAVSMEVTSPTGDRLTIVGPWAVRTDLASAVRDSPVLQLPLGETWIACEPARVNGVLGLHVGGEATSVPVRAGHLAGDTPLAAVVKNMGVVEIGIGVNPAAAWIPQLVLAEKARGHVHIGFGDNTTIGGSIADDDHFDLAAVPGTKVVLVDGDGRRRTIGGADG